MRWRGVASARVEHNHERELPSKDSTKTEDREHCERGNDFQAAGHVHARQGVQANPGESGVVDDLLDIAFRSGAAPRLLSFEFATSARAGSNLTTVGVTLQGNYDDIGAIQAFAGESELRMDWGESAYRKDPNGVVGEGTTRIFFQLPPDPPDRLVIVASGKASIVQGEWAFTLTPE